MCFCVFNKVTTIFIILTMKKKCESKLLKESIIIKIGDHTGMQL